MRIKKPVLIAFVLIIALLCSTSALAQEASGRDVEALRSYVEAMTSKDWDSFPAPHRAAPAALRYWPLGGRRRRDL